MLASLIFAGFQSAGAFTKAKKQLQTGAAAEQMQAIDRQMQELLEKMRRHNQFIGTQHLNIENAHRVQFYHKTTRAAADTAGMQKLLDWPTKIDFSLFDKVVPLRVLVVSNALYMLYRLSAELHADIHCGYVCKHWVLQSLLCRLLLDHIFASS